MNCAHCGKKNSEEMLFCGFCGRPLGAREDAPPADDPQRAIFGRPPEVAQAPEPAADLPEEELEPIEMPLPERSARPRPAQPLRRAPEPLSEEPFARPMLREPVEFRAKRPPALTRMGAPVGTRNASTVVPARRADEKNIFLEDDFDDGYADDFDDFGDEPPRHAPRRQSFFVRHARGLVALLLLSLTLLILGYWLFYGGGQRVLGQLYLSGNPATYITLGDEAERQGAQEVAGAYFLKALELEPANRTYAIKAANAYILAGNAGKATNAIEKLIEMNPGEVDPYLTLKSLYPDPAARPQKVVRLIEQGREQTGDARLQDG